MEPYKILCVDDDELNIDILKEYFETDPNYNYQCTYAYNGLEALEALNINSDIEIIVLDRMMPIMDGMQFIEKIKPHAQLQEIPIIMQTAATTTNQVVEGIEAGVFYYLSKPYTRELLLALVHSAGQTYRRRQETKKQIGAYGNAMHMIHSGEFHFQTINQARTLALLISSGLLNSQSKLIGLEELMVNAVEHGNLGISYNTKKDLKLNQTWEKEIEKRLNENLNKKCTLKIFKDEESKHYIIRIKDEGKGFDWKQYMELNPSRLMDPNGRGILLSLSAGFAELKYLGNGNEVECKIKYQNGAS